jgi:predicted AAA+ superfamily ATPase
MNFQEPISGLIERIVRAIERLGPQEPDAPDFAESEAFVWQAETQGFVPVADVNRLPLSLLKGIDASPAGFLPIMRCCGVRAAWAKALSSRRSMARSRA